MMEYPLKDTENKDLRNLELSDALFGLEVRGALLSRMVNYQLARRRSGTASTKTRANVRGGGKKPYKQKGTGNARQGTIRAPQFRTGGVVFGPHPRDYAHKMTKKERRLALLTALSAKMKAGDMVFVDAFRLSEIKTSVLVTILAGFDVGRTTLIVISEPDRNLELSARNIPGVTVMRAEGVNTYDLLVHEKVIVTEDALKRIEERLS